MLGLVVGVTAHFAWKYSGSNEWKLKVAKDGIRVYSRKTPGTTLTDVKAVGRFKTRLGIAMLSIVAVDCSDWLPGECSGRNIEPYDLKDEATTDFFVGKMPFPLSPREWLFKTQFSEDPKTKAILMKVDSVPDLLPQNKCCYRVAVLNNRWLLTPVENDEVEVELTMHTDEGVPYLLVNAIKPGGAYKLFRDLPRQFSKKKYQDAKPDTWKKYLLASSQE